jgi:hypothetical protein
MHLLIINANQGLKEVVWGKAICFDGEMPMHEVSIHNSTLIWLNNSLYQ